MRLLEKIKLIASTLMVVTIVAFSFGLYYLYEDSQANAKERELEEIVETLETINTYTKPDFERENNQTFINSVGACVNYIYNTTTDVTPVIYEVLLAQAALEHMI
jgi:hypothetical protein